MKTSCFRISSKKLANTAGVLAFPRKKLQKLHVSAFVAFWKSRKASSGLCLEAQLKVALQRPELIAVVAVFFNLKVKVGLRLSLTLDLSLTLSLHLE